jgi:Divergent InlB B-repeat domain/Cytochrome C oxidase, cbb3-type, subunit III
MKSRSFDASDNVDSFRNIGEEPFTYRIIPSVVLLITIVILFADAAGAAELKVMKMGLGSGIVASSPAGINCGGDCDETYGTAVSVTLTATPGAGSIFSRWEGDGAGMANPLTMTMSADRSVRAVFDLAPAIPALSDFTPTGIQTFLTANPNVTTAARFLKALPSDFKQNWILMSRSESLQTGTAESPRLLLPSADARSVFTVGMTQHSSYPGSHPNAIEYMQWDAVEKNFRFHEIVLDTIPAMGNLPARSRGVSMDDNKCSKCHSTRNVLNNSLFPGTTGIPPGIIKAKNKPNWDSYDSWGGMMPFNRDRIYQGSVEAAAFRKLLNLWTWRVNDSVRSVIEQLELQPSGVPAGHVITRTNGGANDGHINFAFDTSPPVLTEPAPSSSGTGIEAPITTSYSFDGLAGTGAATSVTRGGSFITLHHSSIPTSDEGRGVRLFDALGGLAGNVNRERIADELINHRFATGSVPIDVRPIALAIAKGVVTINAATNSVVSTQALMIDLGFFDARNGMRINELVADTRSRAQSLPRRKADIQKKNLDRKNSDGTIDVYLLSSAMGGGPVNGLIQQYGAATSVGTDTSLSRLRQEVFRRPNDLGSPDSTVMGGIYVDRELYALNTGKIALFRYFLEPLGVSVDKWSMGVRGRSRNYTFADVFDTYIDHFIGELRDSLLSDPVPGLSDPDNDAQLIAAVNSTLSLLPSVNAVPPYTDVQRIFNKSCIECHGGLGYPPYQNYGTFLDFSEDENPPAMVPPLVSPRLARSYEKATAVTTTDPVTSSLYQRITQTTEECPYGLMPCGGPKLSQADIETIRRWIVGSRPSTAGDPHIRTVDGINYDFQSAGEFVLLRDEYLEIQARQTAVETDTRLGPNPHTGLTSCVSVNSAVAMRIGSNRITYQPNLSDRPDPNGLQLRIDGKLMKMSAEGIPLTSGGRIIPTTAPGGIQVEAPGGTVIVITPGWWDYYQLWYLNIDARNVRATLGLMGAIAPGNWLPALPDGTLLGPRPRDLQERYKILYGKFGNAWRVSDAISLFDYATGTSPKTFTIESWPGGEFSQSCSLPPEALGTPNKPPVKPLTLEEAEQSCSGIVDKDRKANCLQDVSVTGERGFARTYLRADQIDRNAIPTAPVLVFPENFKIALVKPVTFTWNQATDADGDPISYRLYVWPVNERPNNNNAVPVSVQIKSSGRGNFYVLLVGLLVCFLLAALIFFATKKKSALAALAAIAILAAVIFAYYLGRSGTVSKTNSQMLAKTVSELESGKAYFWKVIAEDGKGGTVESETRRFEIK